MSKYGYMALRASILGLALLVSACDLGTVLPAQTVSVITTDKTVVDHVVSLSSGKDCSTIRKERGQTYCVEDEVKIRQDIHCYKTLGGVTCYDRPDPHGTGQQRVDRNDHNQAK